MAVITVPTITTPATESVSCNTLWVDKIDIQAYNPNGNVVVNIQTSVVGQDSNGKYVKAPNSMKKNVIVNYFAGATALTSDHQTALTTMLAAMTPQERRMTAWEVISAVVADIVGT